jgi:hypothetical protein
MSDWDEIVIGSRAGAARLPTSSTFSSDVAYSDSPTASRASDGSEKNRA